MIIRALKPWDYNMSGGPWFNTAEQKEAIDSFCDWLLANASKDQVRSFGRIAEQLENPHNFASPSDYEAVALVNPRNSARSDQETGGRLP